MDMNKKVTVVNRSQSMVVYRIPDTGVKRVLQPNQPIRVPYEELAQLTYRDGGRYILDNYLQVTDEEVIQELNIPVEVEYNYTAQDVINLLNGRDNMDMFLDCLDFAPEGVISMVKQYAVSLPVKDLDKRQVLKEKYGLDVDNAVKNRQDDKEESGGFTSTNGGRRVKPAVDKSQAATSAPSRRYNVVKKDEQTAQDSKTE